MSNVTNIKDRPKGTVVIDPATKAHFAEAYICALLKISPSKIGTPEFAKEAGRKIMENRDGRFNSLLIKA